MPTVLPRDSGSHPAAMAEAMALATTCVGTCPGCIDGVSQRMLTLTLKNLERDGLVSRTVTATAPPRVDYDLTPLGRALLEPVRALGQWAQAHMAQMDAARAAYDRRAG